MSSRPCIDVLNMVAKYAVLVYTFRMSTTNLVDVVASNIRAESARRGVVQSDIASALGVQQGTISRRWRGGRAWPLEDLPTVADMLGVSVAYLVTDNSGASAPFVPPTGLEPATSGLVCIPGFADSDSECILRIAA